VLAPSKRKQPDSFEDAVERPRYGSSSQYGLEQSQAVGPKRLRQDTFDDGEPSSSRSHLWPSRPAVGSKLRPVEIFEAEADMRDQGSLIPSGFTSERSLHGSGPRAQGIVEGGRPDYGSRAQGNKVATRPAFTFGSWPDNALNNGVPNYESQLQGGLAGERLAPNPERKQHHEGGVPGSRPHVQEGFSSTGQGLGALEAWQPIPTDNERNNLKLSGQMVGPKRKPPAPPETPQLEISAATKVVPVAKAKGEKWKKKYIIVNCPVIVQTGQGFVELRCDKCHCNGSAATGSFWLGARGIQAHLRKIHKETTTPAEVFARCSVRSVSADEVKQIESGKLVIEKMFHKTVKDDKQNKGAAARAQRVGDGGGGERGDQEEAAEARPVRTRKVTVRDNSKGKLKKTTW